jgi:hypothetical protein
MRRRASTPPTFPDSKVTAVHKAPSDYPGGKQGDVLTVDFTVLGIPCLRHQRRPRVQAQRGVFLPGRNGQSGRDGPLLERDRRQWRQGRPAAAGARTAGASPGRSITPRVLTDALAAGGAEAKRAFEAMMPMQKIDVATIDAARRG